MELVIDLGGGVRTVYSEAIDLSALGRLWIRRASFVEPEEDGRWWADLAPVGGPVLGPFDRRSDALDAERAWLDAFWLSTPRRSPSAEADVLSPSLARQPIV
jgi:hypothetical protein